MRFSSAAKSEREKPHLLGKRGEGLLWGSLSSRERGSPSFPAGICRVLCSHPSHSHYSGPWEAAPAHPEPVITVMEERQVKLPWGAGESSCLQSEEEEEDMETFSPRCSKGLLISLLAGKAEPDRS